MGEKLSGRVEDYLKSVYELVERKGYARIKDIARDLSVKPSSVVEMMRKLQNSGFIKYEKYGGITLTLRGREITLELEKRHDTFEKFLEIILVPKDIAAKDAHILEHQLEPKTIQQFARFVEFVNQSKSGEHLKSAAKLMQDFRQFCSKAALQP